MQRTNLRFGPPIHLMLFVAFLPFPFFAHADGGGSGAKASEFGSQGTGLIQDSFSYSGWSGGSTPMNAVWTQVTGNAPTIVTNNPTLAPSYASLNNGVMSANLGRTLDADFQVAIDVLNTQFKRGQWVAVMNAAGTQGYGFLWDSGVAGQYGSQGCVTITKISVSSPSDLLFNTYGTNLSSPVASGHDPSNTTTAALSAPFAHFRLTWNVDSHQLQLSVDGAVVSTVTDSSFSSFSTLYIGGSNAGLFDNLSVTVPGGAATPFTTIEAEDPGNTTDGSVVMTSGAPSANEDTPELEASGRGYVGLTQTGQYLTFSNVPASNAIVIRNSIPDAPGGGGITATLSLYVNGTKRQTLTLSSKHNWLYGAAGANGQSNSPSAGSPHVFWDEARFFITGGLNAGDTLTLEKDSGDTAAFYHIDCIDLEMVPAPLSPPSSSYLSVMNCGATGNGTTDDTTALQNCITAAQSQGKIVWIPPGTYCQSASLTVSGVVIQGAGMWYTTLVGTNANASVGNDGFTLSGSGAQIHDLTLDNSSETTRIAGGGPIQGSPSNFELENVWITHTQVGCWLYSASNGVITGCRVRSTYADGLHLDGGCTGNLIQNNHIRGCGDDGIAVLARTTNSSTSSNNTASYNTVIASWWGMDGDLAGGGNDVFEYNYFADGLGSGAGILMPSGYPMYALTSATFARNLIIRAGGNFGGSEVPAFWVHPMSATISDLLIQDNYIVDSYFSGVLITGADSQQATFDGNTLDNCGGDGFLIDYSVGTGDFTNNTVSDVGAYQAGSSPFVNDGSGSYAASETDNSWQ